MKLSYKLMTEDDIERVIPFFIEYYNADGDNWTQQTVYRRIWQVLGSPDSYCLVAEYEGEAVGFAMGRFEQFWDLVAYNLVEILLAREYQGRGLGTAFMLELECRVKDKGASLMQLESVKDEMHDHFYGKLGYYDSKNLCLKGKFLR